ncbi:hypothetical protein ACSQ6I_18680 [Anabaena sp. WFMT]|uniref:hypothetical protein n=1 Tax=Anabaena sp. WFMT TaxID=3449730 RepID=UPI003F22BA85
MIKLWYSQLAECLKQRLQTEGFKINTNWDDIKKGEFTAHSDMSNGKGYCAFYYCIKDKDSYLKNGKLIGSPIILGIQIDDNKFGVSWGFWYSKIKGRIIAEKLLNSNIWFDLSLIPGNSQEYPTTKSKVFNQYDKGDILYRSKNLENMITVNELIDLILKYLYIIKQKEMNIEEIIESVLNISKNNEIDT